MEPVLVQCTALILGSGGHSEAGRWANGCHEVVKGGCSFALKFNVTRAVALTEVERRRLTKHDTVAAQVTHS